MKLCVQQTYRAICHVSQQVLLCQIKDLANVLPMTAKRLAGLAHVSYQTFGKLFRVLKITRSF